MEHIQDNDTKNRFFPHYLGTSYYIAIEKAALLRVTRKIENQLIVEVLNPHFFNSFQETRILAHEINVAFQVIFSNNPDLVPFSSVATTTIT